MTAPLSELGIPVGVGDLVYNAADSRFQGEKRKPEFSLPHLPGTARELRVSTAGWVPERVHLLTGMNASAERLWKLTDYRTSVVHSATHVVAGTGDYRSGLIALRLGPGARWNFWSRRNSGTHHFRRPGGDEWLSLRPGGKRYPVRGEWASRGRGSVPGREP